MTLEAVISQAQSFGYSCLISQNQTWKILPLQTNETWTLVYNCSDSRWILSVNDVPQLILIADEAIDFLECRTNLLLERF